MTGDATEQQLDALLLAIERSEMRSLRWGTTDAALFQEDLVELASSIAGGDPEEAVDALLDRRLLFRVPAPGHGSRYRSRFAEGLRLLAALRQIFPGRRWESAPRLVADFRVDLRQRQFPRRDLPAHEVIARLAARLEWSERDVAIAEALLSDLSLAAFQERAADALLRPDGRDRGVVIAAGTGAGKTLAYYLPAIIRLAREVRVNDFWTKAISVYPRNELLKDQFAEVLRYVHAVRGLTPRPLSIGALFGSTPQRADVTLVAQASWTRHPDRGLGAGFTCPFAECPECGGELSWLVADIEAGQEVLTCEHAPAGKQPCGYRSDPAQLLVTRETVRARRPDLLFTTAETLNQRISDPGTRPALGLGRDPGRRPLFMLLDEAHTYQGMPGAQAAMVFRRWRHGVGSPVCWAGLSATLRGGPAFFAQLTAVPEGSVDEVTPSEAEHVSRAAQYQVILRADPASQAAVLSTSIQASFLLARLLDPRAAAASEGRAGHRAFVFTDDLDVTNRLFHDLRDAERQQLANRRASEGQGITPAFWAGQDWRTVEQIGWDLTRPLDISRTSSQDAGVSGTSELVVATSSLELGFDDTSVGAVLQHKSPHRASSFVQRKGRAGRTPRMRPWMVTVLSDYGRDRDTYQHYERLIEPVVEPQQLPIANGYVRRMHAGFAFIDWLATQSDSRAWWWWAVSRPGDYPRRVDQQRQLIGIVERILDGDGGARASLRRHLRGALRLEDDEIDAVLWQPPRSLMLEMLPTLARRLATSWQTADPGGPAGRLDAVPDSLYPTPLPDFLPPNLFSDLNLPEVAIRGPQVPRDESLLVEQALRHLAPGRVTQRFAPRAYGRFHWVAVPTDGSTRCELPLDRFIRSAQPVAQVRVEVDGVPSDVTVYRPWEIDLTIAPTGAGGGGTVLPNSNSRYLWYSEILPQDGPLTVEAAHDPVWHRFIAGLDFYLHDRRAPLTVRRFATEAEVDLRLRRRVGDGEVEQGPLRVQLREPGDREGPAAIGYEAEVDGVAVRFQEIDRDELARRADGAPSLGTWRTAYVRHLVASDTELPAHANRFLRERLFDLYLGAVVQAALEADIHASAANDLVRAEPGTSRFERLLEAIFRLERQAEHPEEGPEEAEEAEEAANDTEDDSGRRETPDPRSGRLRRQLLTLIGDEAVRGRLAQLAAECWEPERERWARWLANAVHETLSEAALVAALATAPDHVTEDSVRLDLGRTGRPSDDGPREAWITESTIGGSGIVGAIATAYASEPRAFFRALEFELLPGEFELTAGDLDATVGLAATDEEVQIALRAARDAERPEERARLMGVLSRLLQSCGITPGHAYLASLSQRLLRPEMPDDSYRLVDRLVSSWREIEAHHDMALDLRVFCAVAVSVPRLGPTTEVDQLTDFLEGQAGGTLAAADRAGMLMGLLWARPHEIRRHALRSWSPFRDVGFTDPSLVRELLLQDESSDIPVSAPDWHERLRTAIGQSGVARLRAGTHEIEELQAALVRLVAEPVHVDVLRLYPGIEQLRREGADYVATIVLEGIV